MFQVAERRLVIALRLEDLRNIVERDAFARFVADLLHDGQRLFHKWQCVLEIAKMVKNLTRLSQRFRACFKVLRFANARQPLGQEGGVKTSHCQRADDGVQCQAVGFGVASRAAQGAVGGHSLAQSASFVPAQIQVIIRGGVQVGGVILCQAPLPHPIRNHRRALVLRGLPVRLIARFEQGNCQQALQQRFGVGKIQSQFDQAFERHGFVIGGQAP